MTQEVAELFVTLKGINGQFIKSMDEAAVAAGKTDSKIAGLAKGVGTLAVGFAAAAVGIGVEAVKMAANFDSQMERIHTLAGVPQSAIAGLGSDVLKLAGQVGFSPQSLAEALYYVESQFASTGISGQKAMDIVKTAAEGAAIGGANLVDVTKALDAALASGIPGVQNYQQAMGALNAIVGAGEMTMQDLADSFSTGILAIGKQYGATLTDVGAALATFGDNNIRGQVAATDLRMAIMDLTKQGKPGVAALEGIGISAGQLGQDMQKGGLNKAILDLHDHLQKAGKTGTEVGQFLEEAFTKKSSAPLAVLLGELDKFESKYPDIEKGARSFGDAWKEATKTVKQQWNDFKSTLEAGMIGLGHMLTPYVAKLFDAFNGVFTWFGSHQEALKTFGSIIRTFVVGALITAAGFLAGMAIDLAPVVLLWGAVSMAVGLVAKALLNLYQHNAKFRKFVQGLADDAKKFFGEIVTWFQSNWPKIQKTAETVIGKIANGVMTAVGAMKQWWADHKTQVETTWNSVWTTIQRVGGQIKKTVSDMIGQLKTWWDQHGSDVAQIWNTIFNTVMALITAYGPVVIGGFQVMCDGIKLAFQGVLDALAVIVDVMTGHWTKAWHDLGKTVSDNVDNINKIFGDGKKLADDYAQAAALLAANLHGIPGDVNVRINMTETLGRVAAPSGGRQLGNAGGGTEYKGWHWVGEHGPELAYNDGAGRTKIYPASQSKQMPQGQGAGGGDVHVNVYGVAADPHTLAGMVAAEVGWQLRIHQ